MPKPTEEPLSSKPPEEPTFDTPEVGSVEADERFLNEFSWRDFIALNWPAADNERGLPHPRKTFGDKADRVVWESWKSLDELYPEDPIASPPKEWKSFEAALTLSWVDRDNKPRRSKVKGMAGKEAGKVKLLQRAARLDDFNQAAFPTPLGLPSISRGPLVAKNQTYLRYETRVNQVAYEFMTHPDHKYYLKDKLPTPLTFPDQSIHVKAAWMELTHVAKKERFYRVPASVLVDWSPTGEPVIETREVGLVGLHIVHKARGRQDWVWSTFEHIDNLLAEQGADRPAPSFGNPGAPPNKDPGPLPSKAPFPKLTDPARAPVEVVRRTPIGQTTKDVNHSRQGHSQVKETVWANYKLVGTQWPKLGKPTRGEGNDGNRLPPRLANVTMETYIPGSISCLSCHAAASPGEFVVYPQLRAYSPPAPAPKGGQ